MRAERDHHIEGRRRRADLRVQPGEEHPELAGARGIRHDEQDAAALVFLRGTSLRDQLADLGGIEKRAGGGGVGERLHGVSREYRRSRGRVSIEGRT